MLEFGFQIVKGGFTGEFLRSVELKRVHFRSHSKFLGFFTVLRTVIANAFYLYGIIFGSGVKIGGTLIKHTRKIYDRLFFLFLLFIILNLGVTEIESFD